MEEHKPSTLVNILVQTLHTLSVLFLILSLCYLVKQEEDIYEFSLVEVSVGNSGL